MLLECWIEFVAEMLTLEIQTGKVCAESCEKNCVKNCVKCSRRNGKWKWKVEKKNRQSFA